jgi:curved DNA-binding protein CbpA
MNTRNTLLLVASHSVVATAGFAAGIYALPILIAPPAPTMEEIKAAYHRLAKQWHPDRFSGEEKAAAEDRFRMLSESFNALKDPDKRKAYEDQFGRQKEASPALEAKREEARKAAEARRTATRPEPARTATCDAAGSTVQRSAPPAAASAAVESRPAATPTPPPAAATPAAATEVPTEVPAELQADDQPPLPLADDAGLDELIRVARTTPNQAQRAELLRKLAGKKVPQVIQLFRANAQSPHPAVRAAAEDGMASLFGSTWNRTRAIPPPVQPPRSDDGNRGPGGAF